MVSSKALSPQATIKITLPREIKARLYQALKHAGDREIGGMIMGECLTVGSFRIADITIQKDGGSLVSFIRYVKESLEALSRFFKITGHNYRKYNYLGEWHSHPRFTVNPSRTDIESMIEIVSDPRVGANFAVLLIVRLVEPSNVEMSVTSFFSDSSYSAAVLIEERA